MIEFLITGLELYSIIEAPLLALVALLPEIVLCSIFGLEFKKRNAPADEPVLFTTRLFLRVKAEDSQLRAPPLAVAILFINRD